MLLIDIPKILFNLILFPEKVLPEFGKTRNPLLLDAIILTCKSPNNLVLFVFGTEAAAFSQGFADVFSLHHEFLVELNLKTAGTPLEPFQLFYVH